MCDGVGHAVPEDPGQLLEDLQLLPGQGHPGLLQPEHGVRLEARHDGLQRGEVLQHSQLLRDVDPGGDDAAARGILGLGVHQDGGDDPVADGVELFDGGDDGGGVAVAALVATGPDGAETLVGDDALEQLLNKRRV